MNKAKILIVEDDAAIRNLISTTLETQHGETKTDTSSMWEELTISSKVADTESDPLKLKAS